MALGMTRWGRGIFLLRQVGHTSEKVDNHWSKLYEWLVENILKDGGFQNKKYDKIKIKV